MSRGVNGRSLAAAVPGSAGSASIVLVSNSGDFFTAALSSPSTGSAYQPFAYGPRRKVTQTCGQQYYRRSAKHPEQTGMQCNPIQRHVKLPNDVQMAGSVDFCDSETRWRCVIYLVMHVERSVELQRPKRTLDDLKCLKRLVCIRAAIQSGVDRY
ncbi:hypothetical protein F2P81_006054 [Scophthalmus maximus]|uniref:Uncharacterized protein n=1 Tax=Scophthalmus maximus TaxID=52904 RepID=A0A6A4TKH4_SCOMX|nr:hypothetical protein F2P81_006054 [Scophthalmus maximus]